jgi:hypothetical protein
MARPLMAHVTLGQTMEFCIDERRKLIEGSLIAVTPGPEQSCNFFSRGLDHLRSFSRWFQEARKVSHDRYVFTTSLLEEGSSCPAAAFSTGLRLLKDLLPAAIAPLGHKSLAPLLFHRPLAQVRHA